MRTIASARKKGGMAMNSVISRLLWLIVASVSGLLVGLPPAFSQDFYKGKTITLYVGYPPGGGADSEMRLVAQFYGKHLPGNPDITPMNMPGATGIILANYLYNISKPDGLTIGMPGRVGFILAGITGDKNAKYDLSRFNYIGSSGADNDILWLRKGINIRSLDELRKVKQSIVIGGFESTSATVVVPLILAKYEGLPLRAVSGYPGTSDATLALERGEIDGIFTAAASFRPDLISSGAIVPIFQTFPIQPDLPTIDGVIKSEPERALMNLALGPTGLGAPLLGPPGMPNEATSILRSAYTEMVNSDEYRAAAAMRSIDVNTPNSGEALQRYVNTNLTSFSPDTIQEFMSFVGTN
jgi:tripartite-type tricarboxylate transporter receptor subunit TctC